MKKTIVMAMLAMVTFGGAMVASPAHIATDRNASQLEVEMNTERFAPSPEKMDDTKEEVVAKQMPTYKVKQTQTDDFWMENENLDEM